MQLQGEESTVIPFPLSSLLALTLSPSPPIPNERKKKKGKQTIVLRRAPAFYKCVFLKRLEAHYPEDGDCVVVPGPLSVWNGDVEVRRGR